MNHTHEVQRPATAEVYHQPVKIPLFLQKKKLKQDQKEQDVKDKYFKMFKGKNGDNNVVPLGKNHKDFLKFKKSQKSLVNKEGKGN